ncbi:MAG: hypothetical protein KAZ26_13930 [Caldilineaceae bacterium]|nr:hypothetical protein [Caldilineaceae bacterium]
MQFYGKAEETGYKLLEAFQAGTVPAALAPLFIRHNQERHCAGWSWTNQLMVALNGYSDARTYKGWQQVGRQVRKGEKAFPILEPVRFQTEDEATGEKRSVLVGFRAGTRFGIEQTEGDSVDALEHPTAFVDTLPLLGVAKAWGLAVSTYNGKQGTAQGYFRYNSLTGQGQTIALGVENLSTWCHELIHAADLRLGNLVEKGQHWASETVAELGGCILLHILGQPDAADDGGAWSYINTYTKANDLDPIMVCIDVLDRTCKAVSHILDAAQQVEEADPQPGQDEVLVPHPA